jgi:hypothetical protein
MVSTLAPQRHLVYEYVVYEYVVCEYAVYSWHPRPTASPGEYMMSTVW